VYVWLNDEDTLRKAGSKTAVYEAFMRMLERGKVSSSIENLIKQSEALYSSMPHGQCARAQRRAGFRNLPSGIRSCWASS